MPAQTTCPATFAGADSVRRSSMTPRIATATPASSAPCSCDENRNAGRSAGDSHAMPIPALTPRSIARPPIVGVGRAWTLRSEG